MLGKGQDSCLVRETDMADADASKAGTPSTNEIEVISLDQLIVEPVIAIAMDIEGSEIQALRGAEEIIKKYRPSLAVRLYHRPSDFVEIPAFIDSIADLSYRFIMRYDCKYRGAADLTLYAI